MKSKWAMLLLWVAAMAAMAMAAQAQVTPTKWESLSVPAHIIGGTSSNTTATFDLRQGKGVAVQVNIAGTNAATVEAMTLKWGVSIDGTNYSTKVNGGGPTHTVTAHGVTNVIYYDVIPISELDGAVKLKLLNISSAADATNSIFITNVLVSTGN